MQKKATKEAKDAVNFDKEMKRIEAAALKAYMNDVKDNADYTSQLIQSGAKTLPVPEIVEDSKMKPHGKKSEKKTPVVRKWMEALSDNGQTYYWNVETGESIWEKPAAGYLSIKDQEKQKSGQEPPKGTSKLKKHKKPRKFSNKKPKPTEGTKEEKPMEEVKIYPQFPTYGKWKKVEEPKIEKVDLQLPKQEFVEIVVPKIKEEKSKEFKEKTPTPGVVTSTQGETGFKKRKIASDARKNMRQRLNDD